MYIKFYRVLEKIIYNEWGLCLGGRKLNRPFKSSLFMNSLSKYVGSLCLF